MVIRDRDLHRGTNLRATLDREDLVANRADEHQRDLRRENHRRAVLDAVCAEVRNRERRAFEVGRTKLAIARALRNFGDPRAQPRNVEPIGIVNDRHDEALGRIDRDAEIDAIENQHLAVIVVGVDARIFLQRAAPSRRGSNR